MIMESYIVCIMDVFKDVFIDCQYNYLFFWNKPVLEEYYFTAVSYLKVLI